MKLNPINFFAFVFSLFFANISLAADSDLIVFDWGGYEDPGFLVLTLKNMGTHQHILSFLMKRKHFKR